MIYIDQGESKSLTINVTGDITAEHVRIYIIKFEAPAQSLDQYSSQTESGYRDIGSLTYNAGTDKTAVLVNIEASTTLTYPLCFANVVVWTAVAQAGFTEDFTRIAQSIKAIQIRQVLPGT